MSDSRDRGHLGAECQGGAGINERTVDTSAIVVTPEPIAREVEA